ncbi:MAG: alpha/beta hydrolase domain-containing protein, partial [Thermoguttaceae bacterium]
PVEDVKKAGFNNRWSYDCAVGGIANDFPSYYIFNGALANLDRWVNGTPPPRAAHLEVNKLGTPEAAYLLDKFGNVMGGVRTPYVDVPTARYYETSGQGECRLSGHKVTFDRATLKDLYPDHQRYVKQVSEEVDRMLKDGWITQADAQEIKAEAAKATIP